MKSVLKFLLAASLVAALSASANAGTITSIGWNTSGVAFGTPSNGTVVSSLLNGAAFPGANSAGQNQDVTLTMSGLDIDNDGTANDTVTFNVNYDTSGTPGLLFNQGFHTNWGTLDGMVLTVDGVSGTATDSGLPIQFDGFCSVNIGAGAGADVNTNVDMTTSAGTTTVNLMGTWDGVNYNFPQVNTIFASPEPMVSFSNSDPDAGGTGTNSTLVVRTLGFAFSVPEPSALTLVFGMLCGLVAVARRK